MMTQKKKEPLSEAELANRKMGDNKLQGNDQESVRNQRHAVPDVKLETDGVLESFEKLDKDVRAREDLGKGNTRNNMDDKFGENTNKKSREQE